MSVYQSYKHYQGTLLLFGILFACCDSFFASSSVNKSACILLSTTDVQWTVTAGSIPINYGDVIQLKVASNKLVNASDLQLKSYPNPMTVAYLLADVKGVSWASRNPDPANPNDVDMSWNAGSDEANVGWSSGSGVKLSYARDGVALRTPGPQYKTGDPNSWHTGNFDTQNIQSWIIKGPHSKTDSFNFPTYGPVLSGNKIRLELFNESTRYNLGVIDQDVPIKYSMGDRLNKDDESNQYRRSNANANAIEFGADARLVGLGGSGGIGSDLDDWIINGVSGQTQLKLGDKVGFDTPALAGYGLHAANTGWMQGGIGSLDNNSFEQGHSYCPQFFYDGGSTGRTHDFVIPVFLLKKEQQSAFTSSNPDFQKYPIHQEQDKVQARKYITGDFGVESFSWIIGQVMPFKLGMIAVAIGHPKIPPALKSAVTKAFPAYAALPPVQSPRAITPPVSQLPIQYGSRIRLVHKQSGRPLNVYNEKYWFAPCTKTSSIVGCAFDQSESADWWYVKGKHLPGDANNFPQNQNVQYGDIIRLENMKTGQNLSVSTGSFQGAAPNQSFYAYPFNNGAVNDYEVTVAGENGIGVGSSENWTIAGVSQNTGLSGTVKCGDTITFSGILPGSSMASVSLCSVNGYWMPRDATGSAWVQEVTCFAGSGQDYSQWVIVDNAPPLVSSVSVSDLVASGINQVKNTTLNWTGLAGGPADWVYGIKSGGGVERYNLKTNVLESVSVQAKAVLDIAVGEDGSLWYINKNTYELRRMGVDGNDQSIDVNVCQVRAANANNAVYVKLNDGAIDLTIGYGSFKGIAWNYFNGGIQSLRMPCASVEIAYDGTIFIVAPTNNDNPSTGGKITVIPSAVSGVGSSKVEYTTSSYGVFRFISKMLTERALITHNNVLKIHKGIPFGGGKGYADSQLGNESGWVSISEHTADRDVIVLGADVTGSGKLIFLLGAVRGSSSLLQKTIAPWADYTDPVVINILSSGVVQADGTSKAASIHKYLLAESSDPAYVSAGADEPASLYTQFKFVPNKGGFGIQSFATGLSLKSDFIRKNDGSLYLPADIKKEDPKSLWRKMRLSLTSTSSGLIAANVAQKFALVRPLLNSDETVITDDSTYYIYSYGTMGYLHSLTLEELNADTTLTTSGYICSQYKMTTNDTTKIMSGSLASAMMVQLTTVSAGISMLTQIAQASNPQDQVSALYKLVQDPANIVLNRVGEEEQLINVIKGIIDNARSTASMWLKFTQPSSGLIKMFSGKQRKASSADRLKELLDEKLAGNPFQAYLTRYLEGSSVNDAGQSRAQILKNLRLGCDVANIPPNLGLIGNFGTGDLVAIQILGANNSTYYLKVEEGTNNLIATPEYPYFEAMQFVLADAATIPQLSAISVMNQGGTASAANATNVVRWALSSGGKYLTVTDAANVFDQDGASRSIGKTILEDLARLSMDGTLSTTTTNNVFAFEPISSTDQSTMLIRSCGYEDVLSTTENSFKSYLYMDPAMKPLDPLLSTSIENAAKQNYLYSVVVNQTSANYSKLASRQEALRVKFIKLLDLEKAVTLANKNTDFAARTNAYLEIIDPGLGSAVVIDSVMSVNNFISMITNYISMYYRKTPAAWQQLMSDEKSLKNLNQFIAVAKVRFASEYNAGTAVAPSETKNALDGLLTSISVKPTGKGFDVLTYQQLRAKLEAYMKITRPNQQIAGESSGNSTLPTAAWKIIPPLVDQIDSSGGVLKDANNNDQLGIQSLIDLFSQLILLWKDSVAASQEMLSDNGLMKVYVTAFRTAVDALLTSSQTEALDSMMNAINDFSPLVDLVAKLQKLQQEVLSFNVSETKQFMTYLKTIYFNNYDQKIMITPTLTIGNKNTDGTKTPADIPPIPPKQIIYWLTKNQITMLRDVLSQAAQTQFANSANILNQGIVSAYRLNIQIPSFIDWVQGWIKQIQGMMPTINQWLASTDLDTKQNVKRYALGVWNIVQHWKDFSPDTTKKGDLLALRSLLNSLRGLMLNDKLYLASIKVELDNIKTLMGQVSAAAQDASGGSV